MKKNINASDLPVMKAVCKTCPFRLIDGVPQDVELMNAVTERTLFQSHQICHGTEGKNRKANNRCKGSFDFNFVIYERMGFADLVK